MIRFYFSCVTISITTQSRRKWLGSVDIKSFGIGLPSRLHLKHWPIQILVASTGPATYILIDYVRASNYNFPLWTCNSMIHFTENSIDNKKDLPNLFFQVANNVELDIQSKLASVCGDLLYCDISALETVCSDILLKEDETTGNEVRNTRNKRSSQTNSQERVQKILIRFKMIGEFTYTEIIKVGKSQKVFSIWPHPQKNRTKSLTLKVLL